MKTSLTISLALCLTVLGPGVVAQSNGAASPDPAVVQKLMERIAALEDRLKALEGSQNQGQAQSETKAQPAASTAKAAEETAAEPAPAEPDMHHGVGLFNGPHLNIKGFADLQYVNDSGLHDFKLGTLDLFITSKISDKASFLAEVAIEANPTNVMGIDLERVLFQYRQNPYLNFDVGRYHSAIGYFNANYHHGTWFQTTVLRPMLFRWEDGGGPLPLHNVGLSVSGKVPGSGSLGLHYVAEVGNGRDYLGANSVQNSHDYTPGKAINFAFQAQPEWMPGWKLGLGLYHDTPAFGTGSLNQYLLSAHVVYIHGKDEFINEAVWMKNTLDNKTTSLPGFYSQFSHRIGAVVRPYARYQYINAASTDPVSNLILGQAGRYRGLTGGLRFELTEFAAFKMEWEGYKMGPLPFANRVGAQIAFTF